MSVSDELQNALERLKGEEGKEEATDKQKAAPQIRLRQLEQVRLEVPIEGITSLILHKWSEKALRMMREKQAGRSVRAKKDPKNPEEEAEACTYYMPDKKTPAIPATQFKAAIVGAVRFFEGITMVQAKQSFFVEGQGVDQLIPFTFGEKILREDPVRNQTGVADLRYRYAYWPWSTNIVIRYLSSVVDMESVLALINAAGLGGIGDWRPSAPKVTSGTHGQFEINLDKEIKVLQ